MKRYFVGLDVGSSKTHALIVDENGQCVGFGKAWGGNHQGVGYDGFFNVIAEALDGALKASGVDKAYIAGAGFGVAGYDFPSDREAHLKEIAKLGLACPVEIVNDGVNGLLAGATRGIGVNVTAGSSNNARGRNKHGKEGRIVGNGALFGEMGGGIEIVQHGLQKVNHAWIKRIPPTALTQIYLEATGAENEMDLMEGLSNEQYHLFPFIAVQIIQAARNGDVAAQDIIHFAGEELGWLAVSVARQIEMENDEVEVIQSGSIFEAGEIITVPMKDIVLKHCPKAKMIRLDGPPVVGAVLLGMEQADFDGYAVRDVMVKTAKSLISN
ncbi:MAG TPA: BadF/BadG/BcrA/BcrD ATPase family protein [Anaerolineales bacterium]|jgi:N-acetylglucosamine kinase-like BadF-type ATPase|nr:BadF/BadG/BcrA/BcrD ATPase family protein [Anaerolineales bacterium]HRK87840.1 BadF/BadG/BcrA/BcrD ATPase family protein [Anaerolineales bacterium]